MALFVALHPARALGEATNTEQHARQLFEEGVAAADRGELEAAIAALEESFLLFPHPGTLLNLALYRDRDDRSVAAYDTFNQLLERYGTVISAATRELVEARLAELEGRLAAVTIETLPPGAAVRIDELERGVAPLEAPIVLEPGAYLFEASLEGYEAASSRQVLRAGQRLALTLTLRPLERPVLVVESDTPGARAAIDDGPLETLPLRRLLEAGEVELRVAAAGFEPQRRTVEIPERGEVRLAVELLPERGDPPTEERGFWRGPWPWIIGGAVIAASLGVGLGVGLGGQDERPSADWTVRAP